MILIEAVTHINLPGGLIKLPGDIFMCKSDYALKLIESKSAVIHESKHEKYEIDAKLTVKELHSLAAEKEIDIPENLTKKQEIINFLSGELDAKKDV